MGSILGMSNFAIITITLKSVFNVNIKNHLSYS